MVSLRLKNVRRYTNLPKMSFFWLMLLILQQHFSIPANSNIYKPVEDILLDCGSSELNNTDDNRNWTGDHVLSKQFAIIESQKDHPSVSADASQGSPSASRIPYASARLSCSEFTYSFSVSDGQKFLRLHFFPASYSKFDRSNSLFTVKAGPYTLLKDFNASLTADYGDPIFREYCINVDPGQRLNVTFTPSPTHQHAYAFINGIEVISMPTNLYFTKSGDEGLEQVGHDNTYYQVENTSAIETLYRIDVGGSAIPPDKDTGMFRSWVDDNPYLEQVHSASLPVDYGHKPKYTEKVPNYTAPDQVYLTGRSYGMNETSITYNVTWNFKVDSMFTYMVRLHFCEIAQTIVGPDERVFQIFIADIMAEPHADVVKWTGGNLIPYYKDYAVPIFSKGSSKQVTLSIKLQPHPNKERRVYNDVILNGIEIFKINDSSGNLGGANPDPRPSPPSSSSSTKRSESSNKMKLVAIVTGAVTGFILLSVVVFSIFRRRIRGLDREEKSSKTHGLSLPSDLCRYFTIAEIRAATNNFDDVFVVGVGGFGHVYKGYIDDGVNPVAIKRLKPGSQQGAHEFQTEIEMLSQLRHLHLVSLIGYCNDENEMILVYDFMARGTLREYLFDSDNQPLSWKQRLEICLGAARGLHYLHSGAKHNIIHRDVKSTNILLDEKWVAKVSDFGLSKIGPTGMSKSHISTVVKGSLGYLDPEYYKRQRLTQKSDVYSFGVVLLEVLCGRPPLLRNVDKQRASLVEWVRKCHDKGEIDQTVDPVLRGTISPECLSKFTEMALNCLVDDGSLRPSMNDVVWGLEFALQLQDDSRHGGGTQEEGKINEERELLPRFLNEEESEVRFTGSTDEWAWGSESKSSKVTTSSSEEQASVSGQVFSELRDPTAR